MTYDLICLGNLTIDDVILPDKTKKLGCFGGDTIYSLLGAACWSDQLGFVAPVGIDFPQENLSSLREHGWDGRGLPQRALPSIRNWVIYQNDNQRTWILESDPGDFYALSPTLDDIPADYLDARAFMLLAMDLAAQEALAPQLRKKGLVALDPQEDYIAGNVERILALLQHVDIYLPSQEEVHRILGHQDYEKACRQFAGCGVGSVVVKMGSAGSLIYERARDSFFHIPIYPSKVVDTTGAGDAYCGGFMAMYVKTGSLVDAGLAGAVSASFAIEDFGLSHMFAIDRQQAQTRFDLLKSRL
ncbi:MAG: PfkB family carbohydrate kinase [Anaerolineaceae bacterium]|nr:PfkB family carbohydrate kinase [Anaerolineaceae bacterium]